MRNGANLWGISGKEKHPLELGHSLQALAELYDFSKQLLLLVPQRTAHSVLVLSCSSHRPEGRLTASV